MTPGKGIPLPRFFFEEKIVKNFYPKNLPPYVWGKKTIFPSTPVGPTLFEKIDRGSGKKPHFPKKCLPVGKADWSPTFWTGGPKPAKGRLGVKISPKF